MAVHRPIGLDAGVRPPLVVDLDGTLTPVDTLVESIVQAVRKGPGPVMRLMAALVRGRAAFKGAVAAEVEFDPLSVPWREDLIAWIRSERDSGRRVLLATAADERIAVACAQHLGLFERVLCSRGAVNLKGANKLAAIRSEVGEPFVYVGDSLADLPVWAGAHAAVLVGGSRALEEALPVAQETRFTVRRAGLMDWLHCLRVHHWSKNVLLLVPLLTSFMFVDPLAVLAALLGFLSFGLVASASYVANDIADLASDRRHPRKRTRPLACGTISIASAVVVAGLSLLAGLAIAACVSWGFLAMVLTYLALTSAYSWILKRYVVLDVITLASLYTWRVLAGAVAISVTVSSWLLAFGTLFLFSLALVKRCAELVLLDRAGQRTSAGRDYGVADLVVLWPLGVGSSLCSLVVFAVWIGAATTSEQYAETRLLWLVMLGLMYWIMRLWVKTARGQMHDDPIVFAVRDRGSRITIAAIVTTVLAAHFAR